MADDNFKPYNPYAGADEKPAEVTPADIPKGAYNPYAGADETPERAADKPAAVTGVAEGGFNPYAGMDNTPVQKVPEPEEANPAPVVGTVPSAPKTGSDEPEIHVAAKRGAKKFNSDEVAMFCDQIAMLLNGGISLYEGTYMLYSEMEDAKTKEILRQIDEQVQSNVPLHKALQSTGAFPEYMVHMVYVGEKTGRLEDVMKSLSAYYERESRVKAGIRSAVAYPMILFAVMACIMVVLAWKILPMFERMFDELNSAVAASTENVLSIGLTAGRVVAIVVCVLFAVAIAIVLWSRTKSGAKVLNRFVNSFGPTRKLMLLMATGKFISSMSLMMASGMDVREGLERERDCCGNEIVKHRIDKCLNLYNDGKHLDEAIRESGLIVGMESRLITVAAKTGETDVVFTKLSEQYNDKTSEALGKLTTVIETTLVVVLSLTVGAVLLAVMLPLVSMISSIG